MLLTFQKLPLFLKKKKNRMKQKTDLQTDRQNDRKTCSDLINSVVLWIDSRIILTAKITGKHVNKKNVRLEGSGAESQQVLVSQI